MSEKTTPFRLSNHGFGKTLLSDIMSEWKRIKGAENINISKGILWKNISKALYVDVWEVNLRPPHGTAAADVILNNLLKELLEAQQSFKSTERQFTAATRQNDSCSNLYIIWQSPLGGEMSYVMPFTGGICTQDRAFRIQCFNLFLLCHTMFLFRRRSRS